MARSPLKAPAVLGAITAAVALVVLTAGPAWARSTTVTGTAAPAAPAACQAADLGMSVPRAIAGDPDEGMGKRAWNIVFRNISKTACSLHGWPRIVVRTTAGKTVATTVSKVNYSNLAVVPDAEIVLSAGQSAIVTATSATAPGRCVIRWTLGLTLPGGASPVTVPGPAGSFAPCVGGQVRLSPFYAEQTLTRDIKTLGTSAAPPPFAAATGAEPATCAAAALRASVTSVADEHDGSIIELRLSHAGQACVLPEGWPTVRLDKAGGASQVAKIFPDTAAVQAGRKLPHHLPARHQAEHGADVAAGRVGLRRAARRGRRAAGLPAGHLAGRLPDRGGPRRGPPRPAGRPVRICGAPRVLSFVPSGPGDRAMAIARDALGTAKSDPAPGASGQRHRLLPRDRQRRPAGVRQRQRSLHRAGRRAAARAAPARTASTSARWARS